MNEITEQIQAMSVRPFNTYAQSKAEVEPEEREVTLFIPIHQYDELEAVANDCNRSVEYVIWEVIKEACKVGEWVDFIDWHKRP